MITSILQHFPALSAQQKAQFEAMLPLYEHWNQRINVISRADIAHFYTHHVLHSMGIAKIQDFAPSAKILDVGTGGGFPGIPLAIMFPDTHFTLVDSIGKKIKVVQAVAAALELQNVTALHQRAEDVEGVFDFVVSRAVTRMNRFVPWVEKKISSNHKHNRSNGIFYLKGGDLKEELLPFPNVEIYDLEHHYSDSFFETKKVVYLPIKTHR